MSGLAYLRLRVLLGARQVTRRPGRVLAGVGAVVLALVAVQWLLDEQGRSTDGVRSTPFDAGAVLGLVVGLLAGMILLTAPSSSRFPSRRADVAWLYASPVTVRLIGAVEFAALCSRRVLLWLGGLVAVEVGDLLVGGGLLEGQRFAAGVVGLIVAFSALSIGAASTRATRGLRLAVQAAGVALVAAVTGPVLVRTVVLGVPFGEALRHVPAPARDVGRLVLGEVVLPGVLGLIAVTAAGAGLISLGSDRLRERLVLDAELWAELQSQQQQMRGVLSPRRPPFRGLGGLRGAWALAWFEIAQWRHARYNRWSYVGLLAGSALLARLAPDLIPLLVISAPLPVLAGAFTTGLVLHLRLGTFQVVPDGTWVRVVAADSVQMVHALSSTFLALMTACVLAERTWLLPQFLLQAATLLAAAFAARTAAAGLSWSDDGLRGAVFHAWLICAGVLTIGLSAVLPGLLGLAGLPSGAAGLLTLLLALSAWSASLAIVQAAAKRRQLWAGAPPPAELAPAGP